LSLAELRQFVPDIGEDVFNILSIEGSLASRSHVGGTAPDAVRGAIRQARADLGPDTAPRAGDPHSIS
jgi:argininosuccinate lyase